jgi:hypothetical protein
MNTVISSDGNVPIGTAELSRLTDLHNGHRKLIISLARVLAALCVRTSGPGMFPRRVADGGIKVRRT